jgi:hypothetical protein
VRWLGGVSKGRKTNGQPYCQFYCQSPHVDQEIAVFREQRIAFSVMGLPVSSRDSSMQG